MSGSSTPPLLSPEHRRLFEAAEVVITLQGSEIVLQRSAPLPEELRVLGTGYVVTGHDPRGMPLSPPENERRHRRLRAAVLTVQHRLLAPAIGRDPTPGPDRHEEASIAIWGVRESDVLKLAAAFGQLAVFVLDPKSAEGLHVLATSGDALAPAATGEHDDDVGPAKRSS